MLRQRTAVSIAVSLALVTFAGCNGDETKTKRVRILATTDEHSHLLAVGPERDEWPLATTANTGAVKLRGGVARRATVIEREKADGVPTVLLSNGDFSQGTLSGVAYTVANFDAMLMRQLGYDAIAIGNHELDLAPAGAAAAITKTVGGAPPIVLTNAIFDDTTPAGDGDDALKALYGDVGSGKKIVKGLVVEKGGVKVGIVSAMGPSAAFDVQYAAAPLKFSTAALASYGDAYVKAANISIAAILQPVIDDLRAAGAQVVVLLFHGGLRSTGSNGDLDGTGTGGSRVDGIVEHLRGVDLIIGGHTHGVPALLTTYVPDLDARDVAVMQPAAYGNQIARAEFIVEDGKVTFDGPRAAELPVDDTILPTSDAEIRYGLQTAISGIEASVLPSTLTAVTGSAIGDNAVDVGDLYFYPLGTTTYDVTGATLPRETNALNLDTDAMLAVTKGLDYTTEVALQNAGSIRGDLVVGATGTLGFSDVFRMVSLGGDPFDTPAGPGYPLIHAYITAMELRAAFEQTLQLAYLNNDYYIGEAGLAIDWDPTGTQCASPTACALGAGWVTSFQLLDGATNPVLYDPVTFAATGGWAGTAVPALGGAGSEALRRIHVVTPYLVAAFAGKMGISLYANATDTTPVTDLSTLVVEWTGPGTPSPAVPNVKDHQALARYVRGLCLANGGELPATYAAAVPNRVVCVAPTGYCP